MLYIYKKYYSSILPKHEGAVRRFNEQAGFGADGGVFVTNTGVGWAVVAGIRQQQGEFVARFQGRHFFAAVVGQRQGGIFIFVVAVVGAVEAKVVIRLGNFFEGFAVQRPFLPFAVVAAAAIVVVGVHIAVAGEVVIPPAQDGGVIAGSAGGLEEAIEVIAHAGRAVDAVGGTACFDGSVEQVVIHFVVRGGFFRFALRRGALVLFAVVIQVVGLLRGLAKRRQVAQVENRVAAFLAQFAFFQGGEVVVVVCGGGGLRPAGEAEVVGDEGMAFAVADECGDFAALRDGGDGRATFRFEDYEIGRASCRERV